MSQDFADLTKAKRDYVELYERFRQLASHDAKLRQDYDTLANNYRDVKSKLKTYKLMKASIDSELLQIQAAKVNLNNREQEVEKLFSAMKAQNNELKERNLQLSADNSHFMTTISSEMVSIELHERMLANKDKDIAVMQRKLDKLENKMQTEYVSVYENRRLQVALQEISDSKLLLEESNRVISDAKASLENVLEEKLTVITQLQQRIASLGHELELSLQNQKNTQGRHESLGEEVFQLQTENKELRARLLFQEGNNASLLHQLGTLKFSSKKEREEKSSVQSNLSSVQNDFGKMKQELAFVKSQLTGAEVDNARLRTELAKECEMRQLAQTSLASVLRDSEQLRSRCSELMAQKTEAETLCEEQLARRENAEKELSRSQRDVGRLEKNLYEVTSELATLQVQMEEFREAVVSEIDEIHDRGDPSLSLRGGRESANHVNVNGWRGTVTSPNASTRNDSLRPSDLHFDEAASFVGGRTINGGKTDGERNVEELTAMKTPLPADDRMEQRSDIGTEKRGLRSIVRRSPPPPPVLSASAALPDSGLH